MQYDEALQLFAQHEHENELMPQGDYGGGNGRGGGNGARSPRDRVPEGAISKIFENGHFTKTGSGQASEKFRPTTFHPANDDHFTNINGALRCALAA